MRRVVGAFPPSDPERAQVVEQLHRAPLKKWRIKRKQGRAHIPSPDPQYDQKMQAVEEARQPAYQKPEEVVVCYGDEHTVYRQPKLGRCYSPQGKGGRGQPTVPAYSGANHKFRIGAALDLFSGQVHFCTGYVVGVQRLVGLLRQLRAG